MNIKFSKVDPRAVTPSAAKPGDAGLDLTAISKNYVEGKDVSYWNYEFGLAVEIPEGYVGLLFPRSSISKKDLMLTNSVGVIDSSYRGTLSARFKATYSFGNTNATPETFGVGERVVQLVIVPYLQVVLEEVPYEQLTVTERGSGGFGSSGA